MYTTVKSSSNTSSNQPGLTQGLSPSAAANARLEQRLSFDLYFAIIFMAGLHGFNSFKILFILYINFKIAKNLPQQAIPLATWIFNVGILFANEYFRGYPYRNMTRIFFPPANTEMPSSGNWGAWLDQHGGLNPRWEVLFNVTVLRLISFNMDYYWSLTKQGTTSLEVCSPIKSIQFSKGG